MPRYQVIDSRTGARVGRIYEGEGARRAAYRRADRLDSAYGGARYIVRPVES